MIKPQEIMNPYLLNTNQKSDRMLAYKKILLTNYCKRKVLSYEIPDSFSAKTGGFTSQTSIERVLDANFSPNNCFKATKSRNL